MRLLHWQSDCWVPLHRIEAEVEHGQDSSRIRLKGDELRQIEDAGVPALLRLELSDVSLHGRALAPLHFFWLPRARVELQAGLVPAGEGGRMAVALPGAFRAGTATGRIYLRHLGGGTQLVHRLPPGLRLGRLTLRPVRGLAVGVVVLEWAAHGVPSLAVSTSRQEEAQVSRFIRPPLPAVDVADRTEWQGKRCLIAWWPALTAPLTFGPDGRTLANLSFGGDGTATVYLSEIFDATGGLVVAQGVADVTLRAGGGAWPVIQIRSGARLAELVAAKLRRPRPDPAELARLQWACDLLMSTPRMARLPWGSDLAPGRLLAALRELAGEMPAARHLEARFSRWLRTHPQYSIEIIPGGSQP